MNIRYASALITSLSLRLSVRLSVSLSLTLMVVACSKVAFNSSQPSANAANANPDGSVGATVNPGGTTTTPTSPSNGTPKIQLISPPCQPNTNCEVEFRLDQAYPMTTQFDWRTSDTLYQTPHSPIYGQPGVHYIATSGHVTFAAGQTSMKVYVQNINPNNYAIVIGVLMSGCAYGATGAACSNFFM